MKVDNNQLLQILYQFNDNKIIKAEYNDKIQYQNTGFNDKYAYGFFTQKVSLSRKNKEGNNAFTHDNKRKINSNRHS